MLKSNAFLSMPSHAIYQYPRHAYTQRKTKQTNKNKKTKTLKTKTKQTKNRRRTRTKGGGAGGGAGGGGGGGERRRREEEEEAEKEYDCLIFFYFGESIDLLWLRHRLGQNGGANGSIFATFYYI